jgi:glycosyltransferase involved in cell wall biosynthesis
VDVAPANIEPPRGKHEGKTLTTDPAIRPLVSLVVPVFNEETNVGPFYEAVLAETQKLKANYRFEFVFTDNHSTDATFQLLRELAQRDHRVQAYRFSRNFGFQRSIMTGYSRAAGDAAIQLDVDLQDPPELIGRFLEEWRSGADVVYGVRVKRQESWITNMQRVLFYRLIDHLSEEKIPVDAGDFRLISRRVIDLLKSFEDAQPYLRGTIATLGFKQVGIPYNRNARLRGESKFPFSKLVSLAMDGILNHSVVPLRISTYFGLAISAITLISIVGYILAKLLLGSQWPAGFATLAALILASISINAMLLGIIGEYLGRMYRQMKKQPLTIIEDVAGVSGEHANLSSSAS